MRVLLFGATGKTGSLVVDRAIAEGHQVSVLVRDPAKLKSTSALVFTGDATNPSDVLRAVPGHDAVIDTIGGTTPWKATDLETTSARNIIAAMQANATPRLIVVSMLGIGDSRAQAPWWYRHILMPTFLRGDTPDKTNVEAAIRASGFEYVIVRPPILTNGPATHSAYILPANATGHKISRADLAIFLVQQLTDNAHLGQAVTVVNS